MGAQLRYGTAGATGGGFSAQPGSLQPSLGDLLQPIKYAWQRRGPQTTGSGAAYRAWSFGCRVGGGMTTGGDYCPVGGDLASADYFAPPMPQLGGQNLNFIRGIVKDSGGSPVGGVVVQGFVTASDAFVGQVNNLADGTYTLGTEQQKTTPHYLVAYKAGSPDTAGTTVNTLLPTNVDGT